MSKTNNQTKEVEILDEDLNLETHVTAQVAQKYPEHYETYLGDGIYSSWE